MLKNFNESLLINFTDIFIFSKRTDWITESFPRIPKLEAQSYASKNSKSNIINWKNQLSKKDDS
jgi:hypothetical protein